MKNDPVVRNVIRAAEELLEMLEAGQLPHEVCMGICSNISMESDNRDSCLDDAILKKAFATWEHFSGDESYPIPSEEPELVSAHDYYHHQEHGPKYMGRQREMRIELLWHTIGELRDAIS